MTRALAGGRVPLALILSGLLLGSAALCDSALAQSTPPTGGQLLRQVPQPPQSPASSQPELTIQNPGAATPQDTTPFRVRRIAIEGNSRFSTDTLHALVAPGEGRNLTLAQLYGFVQRITDYYQRHGYPLARAVVPPQTVTNGVIVVRVIEARYDKVSAENHSRLSDRLIRSTLAPLHQGDGVEQGSLDRSLLLLSSLPGVRAQAILGPGSRFGTSDLSVQVLPTPLVSGNVTLDDEGDRYTGRARVGANVAFNDPLGQGDQLILSGLTSGSDLKYGRAGYELAVNGLGTRVGAAYSGLRYRVGGSLKALEARGSASDGSLWLSQPILRGRDRNLAIRLTLDHDRLNDDIGSTGMMIDRHTLDGTLALIADARYGGGVTTGTLSLTHGKLAFDNDLARTDDAETANTRGAYTRGNASLTRQQGLTDSMSLYVALSGQYSHRNLDTSQQFVLGGPGSVRGYEVDTLAGSSGYLATLELRRNLPLPAGMWQGSLFVDHGGLWIDPERWVGQSGPNHADITGAGVGVDWTGPAQWVASLQLATPIGGTPELAGKRPGARTWVQITKGF